MVGDSSEIWQLLIFYRNMKKGLMRRSGNIILVSVIIFIGFAALIILADSCKQSLKTDKGNLIGETTVRKIQDELTSITGDKSKERIIKGTSQLAKNWRKEDGTSEDYIKFCLDSFVPDSSLL